jgi:hypothetical protein
LGSSHTDTVHYDKQGKRDSGKHIKNKKRG